MKKRQLIYSMSAFCPLVILVIVWYFNHYFPFGSQSFLAIDFNQQFIDLYLFMRNSLHSGDLNSLFYSFTKSLGGNMVGAWAYYLLSPFNLFYLIVPLKYISYAIFLSVWLRYAAIGLSMAYYLIKRHQGESYPIRTIILAVAYALNGFAVSYQMVPIFMDALWLLPILLVALEEFLDGQRGYRYVLLLALTMIIQYYMGYMVCLFVFFYTFYYLVVHYGDHDLASFLKISLRKVLYLGVLSLLGIGLTSFILLPNIHNLLASKGALSSGMEFAWEFQINPLDILAKLMIGSFDNNGWSAGPNLPNIYMGSLGLIGLVFYYLSDKIKRRNKIASTFMLLIFFLSISHEWTSKIWHMGQNPAGFFYRFSWILIFFVLTLAFQGLKDCKVESWKVFVMMALTCLVQAVILPKEYSFLSPEQRQASALLVGLMVLILYFVKRGSWQWLMVLALTFFELGMNAFISQGAINHNNAYKFENALNVIDEAVDLIRPDQSDFYRISKTFYRSKNDPMAINYPGLTTFSSSLEASTRDLFENLGNSAIDASIYYYGTPLTDALFGVKYYIANEPFETDRQEEMDRTYVFPTDVTRKDILQPHNKMAETDRFSIYKVSQTLPIAFAINQAAAQLQLVPDQPIANQNAIAKSLMSQNQNLFEEVESSQSFTNLIHGATESGEQIYSRQDSTTNAQFTLTFTPETDDPYFINIPKSLSTYQDEVSILVNGEKLDYRSKFGSDQIFNIAHQQKGQRIDLTLEIKADRQFNLTQLKVFRFDQEQLTNLVTQLKDASMRVERWGSNFVKGSITAHDASWIFTSIPFDEGWRVKVDGKEVETHAIWDALLGFQVQPGDHQIEMVFKPKGLTVGILLSLFAGISLIGLFFLNQRYPRKDKVR
ncbi:YfhO family protein [Facklamia languida]|uniref:YfhO family protein n=1 Tax=Facklamia languida CCUG 37842 TaxID=883113 RepID=H3NI11_9LACT|nr:YfhO family protein [Facklamia languida]EHR37810.1 hypothetical protein HMPREF9708_00439 [Facklamia languida CCUG 37842]